MTPADFLFPIIAGCLACLVAMTSGNANESAVYDVILTQGNLYTRPVHDLTHPTEVNVTLDVHQIVNLDEISQVITMKLLFKLVYNNAHIRWSPGDFGGIEEVEIPESSIWLPDLVISNSNSLVYKSYDKAKVWFDGTVEWNFPAVFDLSCLLDVTSFPHDTQTCHVQISSWAHDASEVVYDYGARDIAGDKILLSGYVVNSQWDLMDTHVETMNHTIWQKEFSQIVFTVYLKRLDAFYSKTLLFPTMLISMITVSMFYLPIESGEKIGFGITLLLSQTVNLLVLSGIVPVTSRTFPHLGNYYLSAVCLIGFALISSVVMLNIHFSTSPPPEWARTALGYYLAKAMWRDTHILSPFSKNEASELKCSAQERNERKQLGKKSAYLQLNKQANSATVEALEELVNQQRDGNLQADIAEEWAVIASAVDRLLGILALTAFLIIHAVYRDLFFG